VWAPQTPVKQTPTNNTAVASTTATIDMSDWQTYTNEEYGFWFRYPKEWGYFKYTSPSPITYRCQLIEDPISYISLGENENRQQLVVRITDFIKSPSEPIDLNYLGGDNPRILLSKKEIGRYRETSKFISDGLYQGTFSIDYDYSGGGFIISREMFVGDNLIEFISFLKVDNFEKLFIDETANLDSTAVRNKIEELRADIGTPGERYKIEFFNSIVNTIMPL
ncbi:MAG: hypothetical protein AAB221_10790, partial [Bacteroidota bacterium]